MNAISCAEFVEFLSAYRDGELSREERHAFEAHARDCPKCRRYNEQFDRAVELARRACEDTPTSPAGSVAPREMVDAVERILRERGA